MGVGQVGYILFIYFIFYIYILYFNILYFNILYLYFVFRGFCKSSGKLGSASLELGPHRLWLHEI